MLHPGNQPSHNNRPNHNHNRCRFRKTDKRFCFRSHCRNGPGNQLRDSHRRMRCCSRHHIRHHMLRRNHYRSHHRMSRRNHHHSRNHWHTGWRTSCRNHQRHRCHKRWRGVANRNRSRSSRVVWRPIELPGVEPEWVVRQGSVAGHPAGVLQVVGRPVAGHPAGLLQVAGRRS